jgi:hypothetical protein
MRRLMMVHGSLWEKLRREAEKESGKKFLTGR